MLLLAVTILIMSQYAARVRHVDRLRKEADRAEAQGDLPGITAAMARYREIVAKDANNEAAVPKLAWLASIVALEMDRTDTARQAAEAALTEARRYHPEAPLTRAAEAYMQMRAGMPGQAMMALAPSGDGQQVDPRVAEALGLAQLAAGRATEGLTSLKAAYRSLPNDVRPAYLLGEASRARSENDEAFRYYDFVTRRSPDHAGALVGQALLLLEAREDGARQAEKLADRVLAREPASVALVHRARAMMARGVARTLLGDDEKGSADRQAAAKLDAASEADYEYLLGRMELRMGRLEDARRRFAKVIDRQPERVAVALELAELELRAANADAAIATLEEARKRAAERADVALALGRALRVKQEWARAMASFEEARKLDESLDAVDYEIGVLYREKKEFPKAVESLEKAIEAYSSSGAPPRAIAEAAAELGRVAEDQGSLPEAEAWYRKAMSLDPRYADPYFLLGRLLAHGKDRAAAAEALGHYLEVAPTGAWAAEARKLKGS
jgi:tetratricopeptide (TPR) repeat protein